MAQRTYLAIDLKSYYASAECAARHLDSLTTNLVVADASRTEKTICLAVSPSLKSYGIPGRARLFEVVQRVKEVNNGRLRDAIRNKTAVYKGCHFCISLQKAAQLCSRSLHMLRHSHFWMNCSSRPVVHRGRSLILGQPDSNASVTCYPAGCPLPQRRNEEYPSYPHRVPVSGRPGSSSRSRCTYRSCRPCAP